MFPNHQDAGRQLAAERLKFEWLNPVVLGNSHGGIIPSAVKSHDKG